MLRAFFASRGLHLLVQFKCYTADCAYKGLPFEIRLPYAKSTAIGGRAMRNYCRTYERDRMFTLIFLLTAEHALNIIEAQK